MQSKIVRDKWVTAKIKVTKAGKILAKVAPSAVKNPQRKRNVQQGFMDAGGVFHPIRASKDYDKIRSGEKSPWQTKQTEKRTSKRKRKPATAKRAVKPAVKRAVKRATPKRKVNPSRLNTKAHKLITKLTWREVDKSLAPDTRRMLREERIALQAAASTNDTATIGAAMSEAVRVAKMWGVRI